MKRPGAGGGLICTHWAVSFANEGCPSQYGVSQMLQAFGSAERQRPLPKAAPHLCILLPEVMAREKEPCLPCEEQRPYVHSAPLTFSCIMNGDLVISS